MIAGPSGKWLVPLADLSLILFIVTVGALGADAAQELDAVPADGVTAALYVDGPGAPPLIDLLAAHQPAEGEQLTVMGYYAPDARAAVAERVEALAKQAIAAGIEPRVIVQPADETLVLARFAHDAGSRANPGLARSLQRSGE